MMTRILILLVLLLVLSVANAQTDNTLYVKQFPGADVGVKVENAMKACSQKTAVACVLVIDPSLSAFPPGVMPVRCSHCLLFDFRTGPGGNINPTSDVDAMKFSGTDLGARINAADAALGANCGTIVVPQGLAGLAVSTAPTIGSCHRLWLRSPVTWAANVGPILRSNSGIRGDGPSALQTMNTKAGWVIVSNVNNVFVEGVWATNTYARPPTDGTALLDCYSCNGIRVSQNHVLGAGVIYTTSTAQPVYANVNASNISQNVTVDNNFVDGQGKTVPLAEICFTQHVSLTNNWAQNALYNVEWWGGNAATDGLSLANTRWAQDITVSGGGAYNVRAGYWGGMGQDVKVTGVVVDTCSDLCLDDESGLRVNFSDFSVHNSAAGALGTEFSSRQVSFGPGVVTSDDATSHLSAYFHNQTYDSTQSTQVRVHDVKFVCDDSSKLCVVKTEPIGGFEFVNNSLENTMVVLPVGVNNSGFRIDNNRFHFSIAPATSYSAVNVQGIQSNYSSLSSISANHFISDKVTQPAGTYAITAVNVDGMLSDTMVIANNLFAGWKNEMYLDANSKNSSITPEFQLFGNVLQANSITEVVKGAHGTFGPQRPGGLETCSHKPCLSALVQGETYSGTAGVASTPIVPNTAARAIYRVCGHVSILVAGAAGNVHLELGYTQDGHASSVKLTPALALTTLWGDTGASRSANCVEIQPDPSSTIRYSVTMANATGAPEVMYDITVDRTR